MSFGETPAILAQGLTKRYGRRRGVENVSFGVELGQICGLLGPIGAGKTTTMRMLVGLSRSDRGVASLLGTPSQLAAEVLARVGVLIDGPAFVPHLSDRRNLEQLWRAGGPRGPQPALATRLATGLAVQVAAMAVVLAITYAILLRRDPAA